MSDLAESSNSRGLFVSLTFWISLFVAAGFYGAATLAPKIVSLQRRENELAAQTQRVESLATQVGELELVVNALENDPEYIAAAARRQLGRPAVGESLIPIQKEGPPPIEVPDQTSPNWQSAVVSKLAGDPLLRTRLLTASAAIILFAFTFQHVRPRTSGKQPA